MPLVVVRTLTGANKYGIHCFGVMSMFLLVWIMYLGNYAFFCNWHYEDAVARFLVLGDPQMEGDSRVIRQGIYGQIDLIYNDFYFKHIVSNIMKYLSPTHVFVLGDLFSSQYVSDREFENRLNRYQSIFESVKVPLYNITGNHDLGYAGEVNAFRVQRFEKAFGKVNDEVIIADHVIGIVNSLNIDNSVEKDLQEHTWEHMRNLTAIAQQRNMPLIIMTHIPLHKEVYESNHFENIHAKERRLELCTDRSYTTLDINGHIAVQNMLLPQSSQLILNEIQPMFIFNGHDHDGCIYRHNDRTVEYTIRSMMGGFGGYAGLFEIRRNHQEDPQPFSYYYTPCPFVSTTVTTTTFIVTLVFVLIVGGVNTIYAVPQPTHAEKHKRYEYELQYVEELNDYGKAKRA